DRAPVIGLVGSERADLRAYACGHLGGRERHHEVARDTRPGLRRTPRIIRVFETRLSDLAQHAIDHTDGDECLRHPHDVHIERVATARVADPAVAPAPRMTVPVRVALEADQGL